MGELMIKENLTIKDKIHTIRGQQVMLDSDLALLYECKNGTKEVNQAVKNNLMKFPERISWVLTDDEYSNLRSKVLTSSLVNNKHGGRRYNPRVFTEQGIYMLSTVLKTKAAVQTTLDIMDAFVLMKEYISTNLVEQQQINNLVLEDHLLLTKNNNKLVLLEKSFDSLKTEKEINGMYFNGKVYDAYSKIVDIFKTAKKELIIVDRYTDKTMLDMIKNLECNVILITGYDSKISKLDLDKYNSTYNNLTLIHDDTFHDRYFVIDNDRIYHSGNSVNHIGYRKSSVDLLNDDNVKQTILKDIESII